MLSVVLGTVLSTVLRTVLGTVLSTVLCTVLGTVLRGRSRSQSVPLLWPRRPGRPGVVAPDLASGFTLQRFGFVKARFVFSGSMRPSSGH